MSNRSFRPLGQYIVVKRDPLRQPLDHKVKASRIILAERVLEKAKTARVIAVGPLVGDDIRPGRRVYITWRPGTPYSDAELGEVEILHEDEVLATEEP